MHIIAAGGSFWPGHGQNSKAYIPGAGLYSYEELHGTVCLFTGKGFV